jgi:PPP family 3-phenylpropionic acid transporter
LNQITAESTASERYTLWPTRIYFLLWFASLGFSMPFLNLFYVGLGLSGTEIGWITSIGSIVILIASPLWANQNDRWRNPRAALQLLLFFTGLSFLWQSQQVLFWGLVLVRMCMALVSAGIPPLSDSLALSVVRTTQAGYGSIRTFGSLGWVIFVPVAGWVVERTDYKASLIGSAVLCLLAAVILFPIGTHHFSTKRETTTGIGEIIGKLLRNPMMVGAALMLIIIGITGSGVFQFQGVYLDKLGASGVIIGIASMLAALVEIPFMIWTDRFATKWGAYRLLLLAMLLYAALRGMVWLFPSIPMILLMQAVGGIAYSFYTVALVRFIAEQTDDHERRTILAIYTITLTSLISILSGPLIGQALDRFGPNSLYIIASIGYLLAWLSLYTSRHVSQRLMRTNAG